MRGAAALLLFAPLAGCAAGGGTGANVETEIAAARARIAAVEAQIEAGAGPLATRTETIRTEVRYRPLIAWAQAFSARPASDRTLAFVQTGVGGKLVEQIQVCRLRGAQPGYWAAIPSGATNASVVVQSLTLTPGAGGISVDVPLALQAATSVQGAFQLPCIPWQPTLTVGVSGSANPATSFRLNLGTVDQGTLAYSLDLVAPPKLAIASRVDLGRFHVDFTLPMNSLTRRLTEGRIALPYSNAGSLTLPNGTDIPYAIAVQNPSVTLTADGIAISADLLLTIGDGTPMTIRATTPN